MFTKIKKTLNSYLQKFSASQQIFFLVMMIFLGFASVTIASITISNTAITGDSAFTSISGANNTTIDVGSGKTLSLQTTNNSPITTGSGLFTIGGSLTVSGIASTSQLVITGIASGTQCLHVSSIGLVSGTGSDCGSGGAVVSNPYSSPDSSCATYYSAPLASITCTIPYTKYSAQSGTSYNLPIVTVPAKFRALSITAVETTQFAGGSGVTALGFSIGTAASPYVLLPQFAIMAASNQSSAGYTALPFTCFTNSCTIVGRVEVTNSNPGSVANISGGTIVVSIDGIVGQ